MSRRSLVSATAVVSLGALGWFAAPAAAQETAPPDPTVVVSTACLDDGGYIRVIVDDPTDGWQDFDVQVDLDGGNGIHVIEESRDAEFDEYFGPLDDGTWDVYVYWSIGSSYGGSTGTRYEDRNLECQTEDTVIFDPDLPEETAAPSAPTGAPGSQAPLPETGSTTSGLILLAGLVTLVGATLLLTHRRERSVASTRRR